MTRNRFKTETTPEVAAIIAAQVATRDARTNEERRAAYGKYGSKCQYGGQDYTATAFNHLYRGTDTCQREGCGYSKEVK